MTYHEMIYRYAQICLYCLYGLTGIKTIPYLLFVKPGYFKFTHTVEIILYVVISLHTAMILHEMYLERKYKK